MRLLAAALALAPIWTLAAQDKEGAVNIGGRLELFVDTYLVETLSGGARLQLRHPVPREVALRTDAPWEGNASAFQSVFKDGALYRMYYRGLHYRHSGEPAQALADHPWFLCYAESDDGIRWRKPNLGLFEFNGSKDNNIILTPQYLTKVGGDPAHTAAFLDSNPDCPPDAKYKIIVIGSKPHGMYVLKSADGVRFSLMSEKPAQTRGAFDSQNLAFWDPVNKFYREYHRGFRDGVRDIMTASSPDILSFPEPQWLQFPGAPREHLYTNQIQPYYRAPHIFMGFPLRYVDRGWSEPMMQLPELDERLVRAKSHRRYGTAITDGLFMTSRDGLVFNRWKEAFLRPGQREKPTWVYGDNFIFWGMVETASDLGNSPNDISLYATEGYWRGTGVNVRRYTLRLDGFVSLNALADGGEVVTKPLVFEGGNLVINASVSAAGSIQVELQDAAGNPVEGYSLDDCPEIFCDDVRHVVRWRHVGGDVRPLAGKPVRLRFALKDADLYSFQFAPHAPDPERPDLAGYGDLPKKSAKREAFVAFQDDFPADKAGSGWSIRAGSPELVKVVNAEALGSGKAGSKHCLKVERDATQTAQAWVRLAPQDAADTENGVVELSARILIPSSSKSCVDIDAFDNVPASYERRAFHARFYPNGAVKYFCDTDIEVPGLRVKPDEWQDVVIRAEMKRALFALTVGGQTAKDLPFADNGVRRIQSIFFGPNTRNGTMYVAAVTVRVIP